MGKGEGRQRCFNSASQCIGAARRMAAMRPAWVRWRQLHREEGDEGHAGRVGHAAGLAGTLDGPPRLGGPGKEAREVAVS
jgi:hypothetical protein